MANTKSAQKAVRQIERRTERNKVRRTRLRTHVRAVEEAIASGDQTAAQDALKSAQPVIIRIAQAGVIHKNTASRKVSRLAAQVKRMPASN